MPDSNRARNWRARAEELRAVAEQMHLADTRAQLLKLASDLERMAERDEAGEVLDTGDGKQEKSRRSGPRRRPFLTPI